MRTSGASPLATLASNVQVTETSYSRGLRYSDHLYGHVDARVLRVIATRGMRVHRVGAAVHVHDPARDLLWIFGVWPRRGPRPAWSVELDAHHRWVRWRGPLPERWRPRREAELRAYQAAWRRGRLRNPDTGRFVGRLAWWERPDGTPLPGYEHLRRRAIW